MYVSSDLFRNDPYDQKMKSTAPVSPPPTMQQQVEDLSKRVSTLEQQVKQLTDKQ